LALSLPRLPFALNPNAVSLSEGLRAGIAVAITLLAGDVLHLPYLGLAALGALLTCLADPGGPVLRRAPAVIAFALCGGLAYGVFGLIRAQGVWLAAPLAGLAIFAASFARIYGQGGLQVGNLLSVVIVLALDIPATSFDQAAGRGLNFCAGAAWAAILTLVIWQIHPYAPARRALADVARKLARLAKDLAALADEEVTESAFATHAAAHRRAVREAIETARDVAFSTFRRRGLVTARAAQLSVRLQALEQIFGALIALSDSLESDPAGRAGLAWPLRLIGGWLGALAPDFLSERSPDTEKKQVSLARLAARIEPVPEASEQRHILQAIHEALAVLVTVATPMGQKLSGGPAQKPLRDQLLTPIRGNLNFGSAALRHALRTATIATPALAWTILYGGPFAHWAAITLILCLQPYFSATWLRAAERIAGTVFGGLLAAAIGLIAQTRMELAIAMLPLTIFAFTIRSVSYGAFIAALTPMIVLLIEQIAPGADEMHIAIWRVGYTLLGGGLAVAGNLLLWPGFQGSRLDQEMSRAIAAHAAYARAVFAALLDGTAAPDAARRAAGMASNNLEAALSRALLEPHRRRDPVIERGAVVDAALRRMAGRLTVLALDRPVIAPASRPLWSAWAAWLAATLSGATAPRPVLPEGAGTETLTRLARQVELMRPGATG